MRNADMKRLVLLWLIIPATTSCFALANSHCIEPDAAGFLKQHSEMIGEPPGSDFTISTPVAIYYPYRDDNTPYRWLGISWSGPPGGALFIIRCDGSVVSGRRFGAVSHIAAGPTSPDGVRTFEVSYIASSGTGLRVLEHAVLSARKGKPHVLWRHTAAESVGIGWARHPFRRFYHWTYSPDRRTITVSGSEVPGEGDLESTAPGERRALREELYCWQTGRRYARCKKAAP
jgi:hypothetical protein